MTPKPKSTAGLSLKKYSWLFISLTLVLLAGLAGFFYYRYIMGPKSLEATSSVDIVIPKGQSLSKTAQVLYDKGLLRSPYSLRLLAYTQSDLKVQAGRFRLSASMTPQEIVTALSSGKLDYWVTLLEGWRREEIAAALAKAAADNGISFDQAQFLALTKDKEGYLFPDTYLFPLDVTPELIVSTLENTMNKKISSHPSRTKHQILTMASLIEREARATESRQIVSGILWKRLDNDWPLQVDATLQYAKGYDSVAQTWWPEPLAADKAINSAYNTYQNQGLPPGPICAPSHSSIQAALNPTQTDYWYYLTDLNGQMHYAADLAAHNQNINQYLR